MFSTSEEKSVNTLEISNKILHPAFYLRTGFSIFDSLKIQEIKKWLNNKVLRRKQKERKKLRV